MYNSVGNTNNSNPSGGIRLNFITTADQTKFEDLFKRATASTGGKQITAAAVRDLLTRSRLDNESLAKIWDLASITKEPYLTFPEFAVAMYLTSTKLTGKAIPNQLPSEVREETEIAIATLASTEANTTHHLINTNTPPIQPSTTGYPQAQIAMMTGMPQYQQQQQHVQPQMPMMTGFQQQQQLPMMTGIPSPQPQMPMRTGLPMQPYQQQQTHTGYAPLQAPMATGIGRPIQTGANKPRLENMDFASKMMPNQSSRQNLLAPVLGTHQQHAISWKISPEEKQRYREIFSAWEGSGTGYLSGEVARQVFMQSGLQENDLMKIWNLADKENRGSLDADEFAIAMHLVYRKLNGFDTPSVLPAELAPPSSVLKKFVIGHQSAPSPFTPPAAPSPSASYQQQRGVDEDAYVSSARHKGPSRFMNSAPSRKTTSYESDEEDQDQYDSAAVDELRLQISTTKKKLDGLNKQQGSRRSESSSSSTMYSMEELKENIRKTQDQLGLAYRGNEMTNKYFQNTETLLDLLETQKSLQDEIQYLCNRDIPVLARQLRSSAAELRDAKVRYGRKNDGGQDYTAYIQPTGPGGATTESDRVRAKAKAMMAARKIGTSSSRDADYELRRAEDEKQAYDRLADDAERDMERNRGALRDIRGDLRYLDQLVESSSVLDKKRFEKGQDMSYELRRFIEQLDREAPLGFSPPSSPAVNRRGITSSHNEIGSASPASLDSPSVPVASPSSARAVSKPRTADEIKKEAERRVQERLDALRAKRGQSSPATRSPQPSTPKVDHEEQAAQQRLREAEQQAQAKLRESETRQEDRTPPRDYELERQRDDERRRQEEMDRQRQLDEEKEMERRREEEDRQRRLDDEKDMEERRRAVLQKEEEQRLARLEALRKAEEEEEAAKNAANTQSEPAIPAPPPPPPPATADQAPSAPPPAPPTPSIPAPAPTTALDTIDETRTSTTTTTTEPSKGSSNNPFAKLQQQPAAEQNDKAVDEPTKTTAADKRVSYNPFAAFSAFSATKGHDSDDDSEDDDGWDVVNQDDSDNDDDFPAAGSAKNLAGKLFDAMSQRQAGGGSPKPFGSPVSPAPVAPATDIPPPPPPPAAPTEIPPPPPPPASNEIPPPPAPPAASDIPPPPAPPQPTNSNDFSSPPGRTALLGQIQQGTRLKKTVTNDRSQASVSGHVVNGNDDSAGSGSTMPATSSAPPPKAPATEQPSGPLGSAGFLAELQKRTGVDSEPNVATVDSTESEGTEYAALWDYDGQGTDDLSFQADDIIVVNNGLDTDDWWYGTLKRSKQSGYFPRNYVESKMDGGSDQVSKGVALYDYAGPEDEGCLTFEAGASLVILDKSLGDWWTAKLDNGKQGLVPANYVEVQE